MTDNEICVLTPEQTKRLAAVVAENLIWAGVDLGCTAGIEVLTESLMAEFQFRRDDISLYGFIRAEVQKRFC